MICHSELSVANARTSEESAVTNPKTFPCVPSVSPVVIAFDFAPENHPKPTC
jgi:hypothetical protein